LLVRRQVTRRAPHGGSFVFFAMTNREESAMPSTSVVVGSRVGLHARPAAIISEAAVGTGSTVTIACGGDPVDAGSALMIMTLGAKMGDTVVVSSDDEDAMRKIADLVVQDLDA
jgi:phosphocarrier protein